MKKKYEHTRAVKMNWNEYLDKLFPRGLTIGKAYTVTLPTMPGREDRWIRQQLNMAIHRRFPDLKADGHKVHVRADYRSATGTEIYVS